MNRAKTASVMIGPPSDKKLDKQAIAEFTASEGIKIACGGTTAKLLSSHFGREIQVKLETGTRTIPPYGEMEGIDLLTEGIRTLKVLVRYMDKKLSTGKAGQMNNGAAKLYCTLLEADRIRIIFGTGSNPAHLSGPNAVSPDLKAGLVEKLAEKLKELGKDVEVKTF